MLLSRPYVPFTNSNLILFHLRKVAAPIVDDQVQIFPPCLLSLLNGRLKTYVDRFDFCCRVIKSLCPLNVRLCRLKRRCLPLEPPCPFRVIFGTDSELLGSFC
jgi:hypothetical protein